MSERFDVVVIGGGTAGLVTASGCARLGRRVALIEREALGGECLWTGCVPTKALIATAKLAHQMRSATAWGLDAVEPKITARAVMDSMREAQRIAGAHDAPERFRALGIDVINGSARLIAANEVVVNDRGLIAKDIVIATGSRSAIPAIEGLQEHGYLDHESFLRQNGFPRSVLILGGGYIGIEFAQIFHRFGASVNVVEMRDIIHKEDAEVIEHVRRMLSDEGIEIHTGWSVKSIRGNVATVENKQREVKEIAAETVFVAAGRRGNIENLGLEAVGVKTTDRSYIAVDKYLQTSEPRIWACGDVHGGMQFTHVAAYEAVKLVRNMLFPGNAPVDYGNVPWTLYTDPEVAHIGMTEAEARAAGVDVAIYRTEMRDVDRAVVDRATAGFIKLVCDRRGRIHGAHVVCSNASTVIEEIVLARRKRMKVSELAQRISSYPSLADGVQKTAARHYEDLANGRLSGWARRVAAWTQ